MRSIIGQIDVYVRPWIGHTGPRVAAYGQDYAIDSAVRVAKVHAQQEAASASAGQKALTWLIYVAKTRILGPAQNTEEIQNILFFLLGTFN